MRILKILAAFVMTGLVAIVRRLVIDVALKAIRDLFDDSDIGQ